MPQNDSSAFACAYAYTRSVFLEEFTHQFAGDARFTSGTAQGALVLLSQIERDREITDIRWAAYMLATTAWETTSLESVTVAAVNRKGKPLYDKNGRPVLVRKKRWRSTMQPVAEVGLGAGRRYHEPVKIKLLPDGFVRVTEHDGDQFRVNPGGIITKRTKGAEHGATDDVPASSVYEKDDGTEHVYYGRGYVQLTWWSNYIGAGVRLGRGFQLLIDPEQVRVPETAYKIMSYGMKTGKIFANGNKFTDFFTQSTTDYVSARAMVNGSDHDTEIAALAEKFESILRRSKCPQVQAATAVQ